MASKESVVDGLEAGMPATMIVEDLLHNGVMDGLHTMDISALVGPALTEVVAMIGDEYDVDYKMTYKELEDNDIVRPSLVQSIIAELDEEDEFEEPSSIEDVPVAEAPEQEAPRGLMSRRKS